jgi:ABC-type cobalamin/Fe3+-siderophores transport system ATPase subunit
VIAGPNGSGKSTLTRLVEFEGLVRLLNPDAGDRHRLILMAKAGVVVWQENPLPAWVKL